MHPGLGDMIRECKKSDFSVTIFTNGLAMKRVQMEAIPGNADKITFSIDGVTEQTYLKNRVGGNFDLVWKNLLETKSLCRGTKTKVIWQMIVMKNNDHEIVQAKKMASENGLLLRLKTFNPSIADRVTSLVEYQRGVSPKPCKSIYRQFAVLWNGDVVPCCQDPDARAVLGNISNASLDDVWKSPKYKDFVRCVSRVGEEPAKEPKICKTCSSYK